VERRVLTFPDRAEIATGLKARWGVRRIARHLGRDPSMVLRDIRRSLARTRGCRPVLADCRAERRRARPQGRAVAGDPVLRVRVAADLRRFRLAARKRRRPLGERTGGTITSMISIDDRDPVVAGRRVPGAWEDALIIGRNGKTAAATLVERTSRFTILLGLPGGKEASDLADILIHAVNGMPAKVCGSLTWDHGTEMARHTALTLATDMPVYFAQPRSPWERPTNENTNGLIREYLPKGKEDTSHQP